MPELRASQISLATLRTTTRRDLLSLSRDDITAEELTTATASSFVVSAWPSLSGDGWWNPPLVPLPASGHTFDVRARAPLPQPAAEPSVRMSDLLARGRSPSPPSIRENSRFFSLASSSSSSSSSDEEKASAPLFGPPPTWYRPLPPLPALPPPPPPSSEDSERPPSN